MKHSLAGVYQEVHDIKLNRKQRPTQKNDVINAPRQTTAYTSGAACLALIDAIIGNKVDESKFAEILQADPIHGVEEARLGAFVLNYFNANSHGEHTYPGTGLAIAAIQEKHNRNPHYVVILGKRDNLIRYYCPLEGKMLTGYHQDFEAYDAYGKSLNWSVNLDINGDWFDSTILPQPHIFILADIIESLHAPQDSSQLIQAAYNRINTPVTLHDYGDIFADGKRLYLSDTPVMSQDTVWLRCQPQNIFHYREILQLLCDVDARIINSPQSILKWHGVINANDSNNDSSLATSLYNVHGQLPPENCKNIENKHYNVRIPAHSFENPITFEQNHEFEELDTLASEDFFVIENSFDKPERQPLTQLLVTPNTILGVVDHIQSRHSVFYPDGKSGQLKKNTGLSLKQINKVKKIQSWMFDNDIVIAGIDFVADHVNGINISNPQIVPNLGKSRKLNTEDLLLSEI